jgi:dinuclear metal center YbgI/SA1388 family protein
MKIHDITDFLDSFAPLALQESYDNCGLLIGNKDNDLTGVLITLDTTEEVIEEAVNKNANLIVSHHPVIFKAIKQLTGKNATERIIIKAVKHNIAIYTGHTNFDNIEKGVNEMLCRKIGIINTRILKPIHDQLRKLVTFVPLDHAESVRQSLFDAGAGTIGNYDSCSYNISGTGTFKAGENTNPYVGEINKIHTEPEIRIETIYPKFIENKIIEALLTAHPYEEVAYDLYTLNNLYPKVGAGMIGELDQEIQLSEFIEILKNRLKLKMIKYTGNLKQHIRKIAVCGGSGAFLLNDAIRQKADVFISADFKYHDYFEADNKIIILDAGHYETEQFTKELIFDILFKKFNTFACFLSEINTNPVNYI